MYMTLNVTHKKFHIKLLRMFITNLYTKFQGPTSNGSLLIGIYRFHAAAMSLFYKKKH